MVHKTLSVLLTILAVSLYGMDDNNFYKESEEVYGHDEIEIKKKQLAELISKKYKQEYMDWKWQGFLRSEIYWKALKSGLKNGAIKHNPISCNGERIGFLSSVGEVQNGNRKALLILQSPYWMFAWIDSSDPVVSEIYALSSYDDLSFSTIGFLSVDKKSLPQELEFNEEYLPGWQTNDKIVLWYYNAQHGFNQWSLRFEELKNNKKEKVDSVQTSRDEDFNSNEGPRIARGIMSHNTDKENADWLEAFLRKKDK